MLASDPHGVTEVFLFAQWFTVTILAGLVRAGLATDGTIAGWEHRIVGQSIVGGTSFAGLIKDGIDPTSLEGASNLPYEIADLTVELHTTKVGVPVLWWRSVGSTHTALNAGSVTPNWKFSSRRVC